MAISKSSVLSLITVACILLVLFPASTDAAREKKKRFLRSTVHNSNGNGNNDSTNNITNDSNRRGSRILKKDKGSVPADTFGLVAPSAAPVKVRPDLDDWIASCPSYSTQIDRCIDASSSASTPFNCKMCLKGLASLPTPPEPGAPGVKLCAIGQGCGQCTADDIRPFYSCGLRVDANFGTGVTGPIMVPPVATTPPQPTLPPLVVDTFNCPALWPGTGAKCVFVGNSNAKKCTYHEYGSDSICTCGGNQPGADDIWACINGPTDFVVQKDDLAVAFVEDLVESGSSSSNVANIDAAVSSATVP